jgi:GTP cyclohydrolase II
MTNNPETINAVHAAGIEIVERLSAEVPGTLIQLIILLQKRNRLIPLCSPDNI